MLTTICVVGRLALCHSPSGSLVVQHIHTHLTVPYHRANLSPSTREQFEAALSAHSPQDDSEPLTLSGHLL